MNIKPPEDNTPPEDNPLGHNGPPKGDLPAEAVAAGDFDQATDESLSAYLDGEATEQEARQIEADPELLGRVAQFRVASQQVAGPVFEKQRTEIIAAAMTEYDQLYQTTRRTGSAEADSEHQETSSQSPLGSKKSVFFNDADDAKKVSFWRSPARSRALGLAALLVAGFLAYGMLRLVNDTSSADQAESSSAVAASIAYSSVPAALESEGDPAASRAYSTTTVAAATTMAAEDSASLEVPAISASSGEADTTTEIIIPPASAPQIGADCDNYDDLADPASDTTTSPPTTTTTTTTVAETESDRDPDATTTTTAVPLPAPALDADTGADPDSDAPVTTHPPSDTTTTAPPTTVPSIDLGLADGPASPIPPAIISPGPSSDVNFSC